MKLTRTQRKLMIVAVSGMIKTIEFAESTVKVVKEVEPNQVFKAAITSTLLLSNMTVTPVHATTTSDFKYQAFAIDTGTLNGNTVTGIDSKGNQEYEWQKLDNSAGFVSCKYKDKYGNKIEGCMETSVTVGEVDYTYPDPNFGEHDSIRLSGYEDYSTVDLQTIGSYSRIYFLATAGGVGPTANATIKVKLYYTDGSDSEKEAGINQFIIYDWFNTNTPPSNIVRVPDYTRRGDNDVGNTSGVPYMFSVFVDANPSKLLKSIEFTNMTSGDNIYVGIYAITGAVNAGAPQKPELIDPEADDILYDSVNVEWTPMSNVDGYRLDVATNKDFTELLENYNNKVISSEVNSLWVEGLEPGKPYYYRIRAVNDVGTSLSSESKTITTDKQEIDLTRASGETSQGYKLGLGETEENIGETITLKKGVENTFRIYANQTHSLEDMNVFISEDNQVIDGKLTLIAEASDPDGRYKTYTYTPGKDAEKLEINVSKIVDMTDDVRDARLEAIEKERDEILDQLEYESLIIDRDKYENLLDALIDKAVEDMTNMYLVGKIAQREELLYEAMQAVIAQSYVETAIRNAAINNKTSKEELDEYIDDAISEYNSIYSQNQVSWSWENATTVEELITKATAATPGALEGTVLITHGKKTNTGVLKVPVSKKFPTIITADELSNIHDVIADVGGSVSIEDLTFLSPEELVGADTAIDTALKNAKKAINKATEVSTINNTLSQLPTTIDAIYQKYAVINESNRLVAIEASKSEVSNTTQVYIELLNSMPYVTDAEKTLYVSELTAINTEANDILDEQNTKSNLNSKTTEILKELESVKNTYYNIFLTRQKEAVLIELGDQLDDANKIIDALTNLSNIEKNAAKSELASTFDSARKEINNAKLSETIVSLNDECLNEFINIINSYTSRNQAIIDEAKDKAIDKLKEDADNKKQEIDQMPNLTPQEKEKAKEEIDKAIEKLEEEINSKETVEDVKQYEESKKEEINDTYSPLLNDEKNNLIEEMRDNAEKAKESINNSSMSQSEKEKAIEKIENDLDKATQKIESADNFDTVEKIEDGFAEDIFDYSKKQIKNNLLSDLKDEIAEEKEAINKSPYFSEEEKTAKKNELDQLLKDAEKGLDNQDSENGMKAQLAIYEKEMKDTVSSNDSAELEKAKDQLADKLDKEAQDKINDIKNMNSLNETAKEEAIDKINEQLKETLNSIENSDSIDSVENEASNTSSVLDGIYDKQLEKEKETIIDKLETEVAEKIDEIKDSKSLSDTEKQNAISELNKQLNQTIESIENAEDLNKVQESISDGNQPTGDNVLDILKDKALEDLEKQFEVNKKIIENDKDLDLDQKADAINDLIIKYNEIKQNINNAQDDKAISSQRQEINETLNRIIEENIADSINAAQETYTQENGILDKLLSEKIAEINSLETLKDDDKNEIIEQLQGLVNAAKNDINDDEIDSLSDINEVKKILDETVNNLVNEAINDDKTNQKEALKEFVEDLEDEIVSNNDLKQEEKDSYIEALGSMLEQAEKDIDNVANAKDIQAKVDELKKALNDKAIEPVQNEASKKVQQTIEDAKEVIQNSPVLTDEQKEKLVDGLEEKLNDDTIKTLDNKNAIDDYISGIEESVKNELQGSIDEAIENIDSLLKSPLLDDYTKGKLEDQKIALENLLKNEDMSLDDLQDSISTVQSETSKLVENMKKESITDEKINNMIKAEKEDILGSNGLTPEQRNELEEILDEEAKNLQKAAASSDPQDLVEALAKKEQNVSNLLEGMRKENAKDALQKAADKKKEEIDKMSLLSVAEKKAAKDKIDDELNKAIDEIGEESSYSDLNDTVVAFENAIKEVGKPDSVDTDLIQKAKDAYKEEYLDRANDIRKMTSLTAEEKEKALGDLKAKYDERTKEIKEGLTYDELIGKINTDSLDEVYAPLLIKEQTEYINKLDATLASEKSSILKDKSLNEKEKAGAISKLETAYNEAKKAIQSTENVNSLKKESNDALDLLDDVLEDELVNILENDIKEAKDKIDSLDYLTASEKNVLKNNLDTLLKEAKKDIENGLPVSDVQASLRNETSDIIKSSTAKDAAGYKDDVLEELEDILDNYLSDINNSTLSDKDKALLEKEIRDKYNELAGSSDVVTKEQINKMKSELDNTISTAKDNLLKAEKDKAINELEQKAAKEIEKITNNPGLSDEEKAAAIDKINQELNEGINKITNSKDVESIIDEKEEVTSVTENVIMVLKKESAVNSANDLIHNIKSQINAMNYLTSSEKNIGDSILTSTLNKYLEQIENAEDAETINEILSEIQDDIKDILEDYDERNVQVAKSEVRNKIQQDAQDYINKINNLEYLDENVKAQAIKEIYRARDEALASLASGKITAIEDAKNLYDDSILDVLAEATADNLEIAKQLAIDNANQSFEENVDKLLSNKDLPTDVQKLVAQTMIKYEEEINDLINNAQTSEEVLKVTNSLVNKMYNEIGKAFIDHAISELNPNASTTYSELYEVITKAISDCNGYFDLKLTISSDEGEFSVVKPSIGTNGQVKLIYSIGSGSTVSEYETNTVLNALPMPIVPSTGSSSNTGSTSQPSTKPIVNGESSSVIIGENIKVEVNSTNNVKDNVAASEILNIPDDKVNEMIEAKNMDDLIITALDTSYFEVKVTTNIDEQETERITSLNYDSVVINNVKEVVSGVLTKDEIVGVTTGKTVAVLDLNMSNSAITNPEVQQKIDSMIAIGYELNRVLDIELHKTVDTTKYRVINAGVPVEITMHVGEEITNKRNVSVLRIHEENGQTTYEYIETRNNCDGTITIWTDKFSQYIIVTDDLDLSNYSNMMLSVYENSRATSIKESTEGFVINGYTWINGIAPNKNTWRELVFINTENPSPEFAYRVNASAVYNTFLNKNMYATQNGTVDLSYANYTAAINLNQISNYTKTSMGEMKPGSYYVYVRISDGKDSFMFPIYDRVLNDGSTLQGANAMPSQFNVENQTNRTVIFEKE